MKRHRNRAFAAASFCLGLGLFASLPARAASLVQVDRATWTAGVNLPSYMQMHIYVPDRLATKPPILVSSHSCGSTASGQWGNITKIKAAADANGFILILPDSMPMRNCWDVGSTAALKHDGGGDTHAVAQMVKYALTKYNGDAARVYAHGGSSGGMMTQALMAVYPDVFRAGAARAGVPAGCWADGYDPGQQWSNNCAGGNTNKTAQQWGDQVRAMFPGYTGHRPRLQIMQGQSDPTISYKNTAESIEEWTNVLGLSTAPTSMDTGYKAAGATYNRQFWKNACGYTVFEAWSSPGGTHSMPYEEADILKFFGLDVAGGAESGTGLHGRHRHRRSRWSVRRERHGWNVGRRRQHRRGRSRRQRRPGRLDLGRRRRRRRNRRQQHGRQRRRRGRRQQHGRQRRRRERRQQRRHERCRRDRRQQRGCRRLQPHGRDRRQRDRRQRREAAARAETAAGAPARPVEIPGRGRAARCSRRAIQIPGGAARSTAAAIAAARWSGRWCSSPSASSCAADAPAADRDAESVIAERPRGGYCSR